ncbi:hypothetical protein O6H91_Y321700 [Diphasiastrum complanatum]|nr:hypothetical protein O6H91_Y321700 [Diphasiastrum complanatum]KAJ7299029.1 hypothetical protein O6H91_Y321700 [Diphasiastrum complanatum]KAJ7299030.1 hypothetical protein O6H91_Y321700 [Diphasiastrum complanatum]
MPNLETELELDVGLSIGIRRKSGVPKNLKERPPVQLDLLPLRPLAREVVAERDIVSLAPPELRISWQPLYQGSRKDSFLGFDVNHRPATISSEHPNVAFTDDSIISFFHSDAPRNGGSFVKREREAVQEFDAEHDRAFEVISSRAGSDEEEGGNSRKKLRLSKQQSALLEESFKEQSTLNPKQKNALAKQLSLTPRQVEVWFQNRRARTKLKQTEVDCELLKRCCENLTEENRRLHRELQDLRALKVASPCVIAHDFRMPLPATTLTMCPSCERLTQVAKTSTGGFPNSGFRQHAQSSAAC